MIYKFKFDKRNSNCVLIYENDRLINMVAIPPTQSKVDIINFEKPTLYMNYVSSLIIFSTPNERCMYHDGILVDKIERHENNKRKWYSRIIFRFKFFNKTKI